VHARDSTAPVVIVISCAGFCNKVLLTPKTRPPDCLENPSDKSDIPVIRHDAGSKERFRNG
jgi:hypothetical protein